MGDVTLSNVMNLWDMRDALKSMRYHEEERTDFLRNGLLLSQDTIYMLGNIETEYRRRAQELALRSSSAEKGELAAKIRALAHLEMHKISKLFGGTRLELYEQYMISRKLNLASTVLGA